MNDNMNNNTDNSSGSNINNNLSNSTDDLKSILPKLAMDYIPNAKPDAASITGLVKSGRSVTGYQLSDGRIVSKEEGIALAKDNQIKGVGVAHKKETEYLKSIPDGTDNNNLSHLPTVKG